jgi:hypothetical protein
MAGNGCPPRYAPEEIMIAGSGQRLCCPRCGSADGLHHGAVRIGRRPVEDEDGELVEVDAEGPIRLSRMPAWAFGGRRHELEIHLSCETCDGDVGPGFWLVMRQHKGQTILSIRRGS